MTLYINSWKEAGAKNLCHFFHFVMLKIIGIGSNMVVKVYSFLSSHFSLRIKLGKFYSFKWNKLCEIKRLGFLFLKFVS